MSDPESSFLVLALDEPCPEELVPTTLGVGLNGPPGNLFLVFREEFYPDEIQAIRDSRYQVGVKLYKRDKTVGLVWWLLGDRLGMNGYANYSLAHVRDRRGPDELARFRQSAKDASLANHPDCGRLLSLVFVDPVSTVVFGLRAFTLPRLFSDRMLAAILDTEDQDVDASDRLVEQLLASPTEAWKSARPGVAVSGSELEENDGEWSRRLRRWQANQRRRKR